MPCRVINAAGETLYTADPGAGQLSICEMIGKLLPSAEPVASVCNNSHLYGCYQAERFGGQYVYFCPAGMTHWASPIMLNQGQVVGALVGGPVHLTEPDDS